MPRQRAVGELETHAPGVATVLLHDGDREGAAYRALAEVFTDEHLHDNDITDGVARAPRAARVVHGDRAARDERSGVADRDGDRTAPKVTRHDAEVAARADRATAVAEDEIRRAVADRHLGPRERAGQLQSCPSVAGLGCPRLLAGAARDEQCGGGQQRERAWDATQLLSSNTRLWVMSSVVMSMRSRLPTFSPPPESNRLA